MSRFFIDRPIFAWVIAIILMLTGVLAIRTLPISQFPEIAPPAIAIQTIYPGADATTLEKTTTTVIEQQLKGIDNLRYFSSNSDSAGNLTITLTFEQGTDSDIAQVQVQNKLQQAMPLLPQEVQQQGVRVQNPQRTSCSSSVYIRRMEATTARTLAIIWRQNSRIH
jgi:HAE1 family hydrophobic/amphiphilic exporter-1/multidrug efflux pump